MLFMSDKDEAPKCCECCAVLEAVVVIITMDITVMTIIVITITSIIITIIIPLQGRFARMFI